MNAFILSFLGFDVLWSRGILGGWGEEKGSGGGGERNCVYSLDKNMENMKQKLEVRERKRNI